MNIFGNKFIPGKNVVNIGWDTQLEEKLPVHGLREFGYISGYKEGADKLADLCRHDETLIFPAVFLYRQYLELLLKNLNSQLNKPVNFNKRPHDIKFIWSKMYPEVKKGLPITQQQLTQTQLNFIRDVVYHFSKIDPNSSNFRFFGQHGNKKTLRGEITVDLKKLKDSIDKVDTYLYGTYGGV